MHRTRIKICGITQHSDAMEAINAGADALGLVFYARSARAVSAQQAEQVVAGLPPFVTLVGLFVDAEPREVREACERLPLTLLQFHGDETNDYCEQFGLPWIKALRVGGGSDISEAIAGYPGASGVLLDTWRADTPGGTGESFDWALVPGVLPRPLVLAGGLKADNVAAAIKAVHPYAVDVSGGVEASPGIKDAGKIREFVAAVAAADSLSEAGK